MKPKRRSMVRIYLGKLFYTLLRYLEWNFGNVNFAKTIIETNLSYTIFHHETPLLRKLNNVDMWLQHNKIKNLLIAVKQLNGLLLKPGETFSYWKLIGKPTKRKGYVEGMVLFYGSFKPGLGGGLCQLSNLIHWITLHSPLTIVERHRHSYDVFPDSNRTQPFGSGATCSYNYLDLRIKNDTDVTYQLNVFLNEDSLIGEWRTDSIPIYNYEVYEKEHHITSEPWNGYVRHNLIFRKVFNLNKELIEDAFITENHALMMYQPFLKEAKYDKSDNI